MKIKGKVICAVLTAVLLAGCAGGGAGFGFGIETGIGGFRNNHVGLRGTAGGGTEVYGQIGAGVEAGGR